MSSHDYILDDATGANFRLDLNNALKAIVTNNSNSNEPTISFAYQMWADTSTNILKIRNSSNTEWIDVLFLTNGEPTGKIDAYTKNETNDQAAAMAIALG